MGLFDDNCEGGPPPPPLGGFQALTQACLANDTLFNVTAALGAGASPSAIAAERFSVRTQCRPRFLDGLEWALDAIFYADMLLKFVTAVPVERSLELKCAPDCHARLLLLADPAATCAQLRAGHHRTHLSFPRLHSRPRRSAAMGRHNRSWPPLGQQPPRAVSETAALASHPPSVPPLHQGARAVSHGSCGVA